MPIDTLCPHCAKAYRLKDETAGKSVKCGNPDCRKAFVVVPLPPAAVAPAAVPPPAAKPAPPKPAPPKPVPPRAAVTPSVRKGAPDSPIPATFDADELAARLYSEQVEKAAEAPTFVDVVCQVCEHKWQEPSEKAGKFVICPECKHRQKAAEPKAEKKADWRDATGGRRSLEKGPELPADLRDQELKQADIESLKQAGAIAEPELEPIPLSTKLRWAFLGVVVLGAVVGGVFWAVNSFKTRGDDDLMAVAVKEIKEIKDDGPQGKSQPALMRALLHTAAGEYDARVGTEAGLKSAAVHFGEAKKELDALPRATPERDAVYGELATGVLSLGGDAEQVKGGIRLAWAPATARTPINNTPFGNVQEELRRLLQSLHAQGKEADLDFRYALVARLAGELTRRGQPEVMPGIVRQGFSEQEEPEATARVLLAEKLAGADDAALQPAAKALAVTLAAAQKENKLGGFVSPVSAPALWQKLSMTKDAPPVVQRPPSGGTPPVEGRIAFAVLDTVTDKPADGLTLASRAGKIDDRLRALAAVAEVAADPKPAVEAAADAMAKDRANIGKGIPFALLRLAQAAGRAGMKDKAEAFAGAIPDDGLKEWARADALRLRIANEPAAPAATDADRPPSAAGTRAGHAWGCLAVARRRAAVTGDAAGRRDYEGWGDLRGFGYAGLALGLKDREGK